MPVNRECLYCASRFEADVHHRLFCSDRCRCAYDREDELKCFYCGVLAETKDHITPQSLKIAGNVETVRCCKECNSRLRNTEPFDLPKRIQWLITRTRLRYKLDDPVPEWSDEELEDLGYTLRVSVQGLIYMRQRAIDRVAHMNRTLLTVIQRSEQ